MDDAARGSVALPHPLPDRLRSVEAAFVAAIVGAWVVLYLVGLGDLSIHVWDESRYVSVARDMAQGADWLIPELRVNTFSYDLDPSVRLQKPPLLYWLQALSMSVFGATAFAARLPTALATLGCALIVFFLGRRTYDSRAGFAGAILFLVFPGMLLGSHGGTAAVPDTLMAFFGSLFVWLTWVGRTRPRLLVPAGICAGLAVMTKGFAAGVFVIVLAPIGLRYLREYTTRWTLAAITSTIIVALPWHVYAYLTHPAEFIHDYFEMAVASRVAGQLASQEVEPLVPFFNYPYLRYALDAILPPYPYLLPVFAIGAVAGLGLVVWWVRRDGLSDHLEKAVLVWWALAVPVTFALAGGNQPWYLLPMYLPGMAVMGYVPAAIADGTLTAALRSVGPGRAILRHWPGSIRHRIGARLTPRQAAAAFAVVVLLVGAGCVTAYGPPLHEEYNDGQRDVGEALTAAVPPEETVYVVLDRDTTHRAIMATEFYADRDLAWTTPVAVNTNRSIRYAILPFGSEGFGREHRVLAESPSNNIEAVAFED